MQWLRLRPESSDELEMVDWRGRWLDDDDEYDDDDDEVEEEEDRQMEDFDPDANDEDDDDDDEEEEEEEEIRKGGARVATTGSARTTPTAQSLPVGSGKLRVVKQWSPAVHAQGVVA